LGTGKRWIEAQHLDNLPDNAGGVSLLITQEMTPTATPEPAMLIPLIGAAMFLVLMRRRRVGSTESRTQV